MGMTDSLALKMTQVSLTRINLRNTDSQYVFHKLLATVVDNR